MTPTNGPEELVLEAPRGRDRRWITEFLRDEAAGGGLLVVAAMLGLILANSPVADGLASLLAFPVGPAQLHLSLPVSVWAADGVLALFFFVVGCELKRELVVGSLSRASQAVVPIAAALGGMAVPAAIFAALNVVLPGGAVAGWGIPMATDIAFALAVLALFGRRMPIALRAFLLTLAIADDLGAIVVIAVFYSGHIDLAWLAAAVAVLCLVALAQRLRVRSARVYVPLAVLAWAFMHESGVHATIAGVALGLLARVRPDPGEEEGPAERLAHRLHPVSAGVAVPVFAFTAAAIDLRSLDVVSAASSPVFLGAAFGLLIGKPVGIIAAARLVVALGRSSLAEGVGWWDIGIVGVLAGVGFTVSLLVAELAYPGVESLLDAAKLGVFTASIAAAALAAVLLTLRGRR